MKRFCCMFLMLLLLTGCAAPAGPTPAPQSAPPAAEEPAPPTTEPEKAEKTEQAEPITAESLRAEYEAQGFVVREIVPYEGDFLVYCGSEPYNGSFQWVYGETGLRAPLLFSGQEILSFEILQPGYIRVLTGGTNVYNGAMSFPVYQNAMAALPVSPEGEAFSDLYNSGITQQETYWAPLAASHTFGWDHGEIALVDVRIGANGVEAVFGPTAENIGGFFAAASSIPVTEPIYDEASHTLTLRFRNTTLTSGQRTEFTDETEKKYYMDAQTLYALPTAFPAGTVSGSNDFIQTAAVREDGTDTLLILTLREHAEQYTVDGGQLLRNESRPYLRLSLRETRGW